MREELTPAPDGGKLNCVTIFNKAYLKEYGKIGGRRVRPEHKFPYKDEFRWANIVELTLPPRYNGKLPPMYKELFGGDLCYQIGTTNPADTDAVIAGSPDYKYGTIMQKKAIV